MNRLVTICWQTCAFKRVMEKATNSSHSYGKVSSPADIEANGNEEVLTLENLQSMDLCPNEDTPLIEEEAIKEDVPASSQTMKYCEFSDESSDDSDDNEDSQSDTHRRQQRETLWRDIFANSTFVESTKPDEVSKTKLRLLPEDHVDLRILLDEESTSSKNENTEIPYERRREIAEAIYLDDAESLKILLTQGTPLSTQEIQRRIFQAVELNRLKYLDFISEEYEKFYREPNMSKLFYRRAHLSYGSFSLNDHPKETALHVLASKPNSTEAVRIFENRPLFLRDFSDIPDSHGSTPLLVAVKSNNIEVVRLLLLRTRPDVNSRNKHGESPILVAAVNNDADLIRTMLETYDEPRERRDLLDKMSKLVIDGNSHTILYPASQSGKPEVLNLIMELDCLSEFLEAEKEIKGDWEKFVGNVCAIGCKKLAKACFKLDPSLLDEGKGEFVTPLMRAAEAYEIKIVRLIFKIKPDHKLLDICDKTGKNVFHYAVKNPGVLFELVYQVFKIGGKYDAINKMDGRGNTPLKIAVDGKHTESLMFLVNFAMFEVFSADCINNVDIEVLKKSLDICKQKAPEEAADLLRGDHEKYRPFLEAAFHGNIELMEYLIQEGANRLQRTPANSTAIHNAVLGGNIDAVEYLLESYGFLEMIDFTDEKGITAAGYATQAGHAEILRYLLKKGAKLESDEREGRVNVLDAAYDFYEVGEASIKEIVMFCTRNGELEPLRKLFEDTRHGPDMIMAKLVQEIPDTAIMVLNYCVRNEERFDPLFAHLERIMHFSTFIFHPGKGKGKLEAIKSMVESQKADIFLRHPLVTQFLRAKSLSGMFFLNFLLYTTFVLPLTIYCAIQSGGVQSLESSGMIALSVIIFIACGFHFIKEIFQMVFNVKDYLLDAGNLIELVMYICAVIYVAPGESTKTSGQIAAGAISIFLAWINFSLFLKTISSYGIYIVMAIKVFETVCLVLPLVVLFTIAFSLSFMLLMPQDPGFDNLPISFLTTFVMMTGELDYRDTFLASGPLHVMQKIFLLLFILMISIAIMNIFTGLAVSDANEILSQSKEKRRIDRANLGFKMVRGVVLSHHWYPDEIVVHLDNKRNLSWLSRLRQKIFNIDDDEDELPKEKLMDDKEEKYADELWLLKGEVSETNALVSSVKQENEIANERLKKIEGILEKMQVRNTFRDGNDEA
ncbi:transient receptor potential cation channel subfamily A member 1-like [Dendronephthya gigantea]|uniref:transient receptor potential cation channel subfamily A member 1-like n=1 Tax=Dendronephthya gigantea TaxID=151771 RepID=UPI00106BA8C0|nr:transient receptor potential cation channel subfamily A member 1-like [Dendronephthya gigantea]